MKQITAFTLDLTKMKGNGDFPCPGCGTLISPDDCSEETYSVIEPKVDELGLEELIIRCNKCASQLHLTGFSMLQRPTHRQP